MTIKPGSITGPSVTSDCIPGFTDSTNYTYTIPVSVSTTILIYQSLGMYITLNLMLVALQAGRYTFVAINHKGFYGWSGTIVNIYRPNGDIVFDKMPPLGEYMIQEFSFDVRKNEEFSIQNEESCIKKRGIFH